MVALIELVAFVVVCRAVLRERFDEAASSGRGIEKQHAAGFAAGVLPGMRDIARNERASAGLADGNLVADPKVNSPASTQATSSLSRCRWWRLAVPAGRVSSNIMILPPVSRPSSFSAKERPGVGEPKHFAPPAGTTKPVVALMLGSSAAGRNEGKARFLPSQARVQRSRLTTAMLHCIMRKTGGNWREMQRPCCASE
jgi:hypothetical protein